MSEKPKIPHSGDCSIWNSQICDCGALRTAASSWGMDDAEVCKAWIGHQAAIDSTKGSLAEEMERIAARDRLSRLRQALDIATELGIYPQSISGGENSYAERTQFMIGWNAHATMNLREIIKVLRNGDWAEASPKPQE